jgi:hypothetical protein
VWGAVNANGKGDHVAILATCPSVRGVKSRPLDRDSSWAFRRCSAIFSDMLRSAYLSEKLRRPLATKDGDVLHTVSDAADYMVALPQDRRRAHWQRAAQLILDGADVPEISRQVELALFYDRKLHLGAMRA